MMKNGVLIIYLSEVVRNNNPDLLYRIRAIHTI